MLFEGTKGNVREEERRGETEEEGETGLGGELTEGAYCGRILSIKCHFFFSHFPLVCPGHTIKVPTLYWALGLNCPHRLVFFNLGPQLAEPVGKAERPLGKGALL